MNKLLEEAKQKRTFVAHDVQINSWDDVRSYFEKLLAFDINSEATLKQFLTMRSELEAVLEEDMSWRYIKMTCDTTNEQLRESFNVFTTQIDPEIQKASNLLDKKCLESPYFQKLSNRCNWRKSIKMFS